MWHEFSVFRWAKVVELQVRGKILGRGWKIGGHSWTDLELWASLCCQQFPNRMGKHVYFTTNCRFFLQSWVIYFRSWVGKMERRSGKKDLKCRYVCMLSHVLLFATLWTVAHQTPLSVKFSRQEYWSGLPFPGKPLKGGFYLTFTWLQGLGSWHMPVLSSFIPLVFFKAEKRKKNSSVFFLVWNEQNLYTDIILLMGTVDLSVWSWGSGFFSCVCSYP